MRQRFYPALLLGFLGACAGNPAASVKSADTTDETSSLTAGQTYRIMSVNSGLALDVIGLSLDAGTQVQQWAYWNGLNQRWTLQNAANGAYQIINVNSGKCLDVSNVSKAPGAIVWQWGCLGTANQAWQLVPVDNGAFEIVSVNSGLALDVIGVSKNGGARLQQWNYWAGDNQKWLVQAVDSAGNPTGATGPVASPPPATSTPAAPSAPNANFGNRTMHPEKIGFYMVPDLEGPYTSANGSPAGWCAWTHTQASLIKLHQLLPATVVRWDNETGHNSDSTGNVDTFLSCANNAGVKMIIAATAVDGYNNYWANGNRTPNASLVDFANGPYLSFAHTMLTRYPVVQLVETPNEADGPWFNNDGDNTGDFDYYMNKLTAAMGSDTSRIVGPAAAIHGSRIWNDFTSRGNMSNVSYHTYSAAGSLFDVPGKSVYVTEYGGYNLDPGAILADLWQAERQDKLSGSIASLSYVQLTQNGSNRGAFNENAMENNHFAFRDWFRALTLYNAVAVAGGSKAYFDDNNSDFVAADNGQGGFASLLWNNSNDGKSATRHVPSTSVSTSAPLYVVRVTQGDAHTAQCAAVASQSWISVHVSQGAVDMTLNNLPAHAAVLVSTRPCDDLAN